MITIHLLPTCIGLFLLILMGPSHCALQCNKTGKIEDWKNIDDSNLDEVRYPGEWIVIDCRVNDNTVNVSLWRSKKKIVPDQRKVMELNQVFNITNLTFNDKGNYYCRACNKMEKSLGHKDVASDGKAYQKPEILNKSESIYNITYGSSLSMVCKVVGWYKMVWHTNNGRKLTEKDEGYEKGVIHMTKKRLIIKRFTERDNGIYTCEVQRQGVGWKAEDYVHLKVKEVKPFLQKKKRQHNVNNTQKFILLRCEVEKAYPSAVFYWSECIDALNNCSNVKVGWFKRNGNSSTNESTLMITKQEFYKVSYRCTARNKLGEDTFVQEIINKNGSKSMTPQITKTPKFEKAGDNITMVCQSNGSVTMKWIKKYQTLPSNDASFNQHGLLVTRKILEVRNFSKQNEGIYKCQVAAIKFNWSNSKTIAVKFRVKPEIMRGDNLEIDFYKDIPLKCKLSKKPIPQANISWTRCVCADISCSTCMGPGPRCSHAGEKLQNTTDVEYVEMSSTLTIKQQTSEKVMYQCMAENEAGCDKRKWIILKNYSAQKGSIKVYLITIYCTIGSLMLIILLIIAMVLYRRKKLYGRFYIFTAPPMIDYITRLDEDKSLIEQSNKLPYIAEWEFPRERVQLEKDIGNGAFGRVYVADVIGISAFNPRKALEEKSKQNRLSFFRNRKRNSYLYCTMIAKAAIKMLNENWNESELSDLLTELKLLIHVGQHDNVVNILGACTQGPRGKAWIIMEYCKHGNLSEFLKGRRTIFESGWPVFSEDQNEALSHSDLTAISLQVALGMKFLLSRKCIHRDLAARNVLIGDGFVPKIADFGLARNIYKNQQYVKKNSGLLPIKWMSIEAIRDMVFSEKSDIWSFGILLWEIFSMGGSPYIGISGSQIYEYLCQGNRMQPPIVCPNDIYNVMLECWKTEPDERPDFQTVEEKFRKILMDRNRPWIYQFELQDETEASPKNNKNISYEFKTSRNSLAGL